MSARDRLVGSYLGRLVVYLAAAAVGSALGSTFTWSTDEWGDANPLTDAWVPMLFSLGPAIAIAAVARLDERVIAPVAAGAALAMMAIWWAFARDDSSTSALVALWGWIAGIPAAVALVAVSRRTGRPGHPPPPS